MFYHFKINKESNGYWAECVELKGCNAQGDDLKELQKNMNDSLNLFLSEPGNSKYIFPMPLRSVSKFGKALIEKVKVNSSVAFATLIRQTRLKHKFTLKEMATILDYKNINTYIKLEKPKTANPELKTLANIKKHFADFPVEKIF